MKPTTPTTLGATLRAARKRQGLTLRDLGLQVDLSYVFLSCVERDKERPSRATLEKLARELWLDLDPLLALAGFVPRDIEERLLANPDLWFAIRALLDSDVCDVDSRPEHLQGIFQWVLDERGDAWVLERMMLDPGAAQANEATGDSDDDLTPVYLMANFTHPASDDPAFRVYRLDGADTLLGHTKTVVVCDAYGEHAPDVIEVTHDPSLRPIPAQDWERCYVKEVITLDDESWEPSARCKLNLEQAARRSGWHTLTWREDERGREQLWGYLPEADIHEDEQMLYGWWHTIQAHLEGLAKRGIVSENHPILVNARQGAENP